MNWNERTNQERRKDSFGLPNKTKKSASEIGMHSHLRIGTRTEKVGEGLKNIENRQLQLRQRALNWINRRPTKDTGER